MDCHEALEYLDASAAGAGDDAAESMQAAQRHLAECAQCQVAWPERERWGRTLARAMQDVAVPAHLGARLHALVPQSAAAPPSQPRRIGRRAWIAAGSAAALVAAAIVLWPSPPPVRLVELQAAADVSLEGLPAFSQSFAPRLPKDWEPYFRLDPKFVHGYPESGGAHAGAMGLVPFQFTFRRGATPLHGRLLILQRNQLHPDDVPTRGFAAAQPGYIQAGSGGGAWLAWIEDDLVYVCLVPAGPAALFQFQQTLTSSRPLS
jgi:hypothetical protein